MPPNPTIAEPPAGGLNWLITGVCGSVGRELLSQCLEQTPGRVIGIDNNESALFALAEHYRGTPQVEVYLADIRNYDEIVQVMSGVDIVLHCAAFKHVVLCERSPQSAVANNIIGIQNVIGAAIANQVQRLIFTSSDKAVNPTNVMGTSKLMGERLITAANAQEGGKNIIFASTRFGNVLGSNGSVLPVFRSQIARGGPVTLTSREMSRFVMTLEESVRLVLRSAHLACGGEVFVTKMPVIRIGDLAEVMIAELAPKFGYDPADIGIDLIGPKPGEKTYEELMNGEELRRTIEIDEYFVVKPAFLSLHRDVAYRYSAETEGKAPDQVYNSANMTPLSKPALRDYLLARGFLDGE